MHLGHLLLVILQRQKSAYTAYPKAEPTPVASSAPPASSLYSSPVVSLPFSSAPAAWTPFLWDGGASDCASAGMLESPGQGQRQPGTHRSRLPGQDPGGAEDTARAGGLTVETPVSSIPPKREELGTPWVKVLCFSSLQ